MFERELKRLAKTGGRDVSAAALSLSAPHDTVLDRLEYVVDHVETQGPGRDQRTARRWSDEGLKTIAAELVYLADIQGRLGGELLTIELGGTIEDGLSMVVWQLTAKHLPSRAPLVRFWQYRHETSIKQDRSIVYDLDQVDAPEASSAVYRLTRHAFQVALPKNLTAAVVAAGEAVYRISIEGRDAPMRTISFMDDSSVGDAFAIRFTTYRTHATIEVVKAR